MLKNYTNNTNNTMLTKYGITLMDSYSSQVTNTTPCLGDDFLLVKGSEFRNEKEYKKHFNSLSRNKTINNIMNHIVI